MDIVLTVYHSRKLVLARSRDDARTVVLWRGEEYDAAGSWTIAQAVERYQSIIAAEPAN